MINKFATDPQTNWEVRLYDTTTGGVAIARHPPDKDWQYLTLALSWADKLVQFANWDEARNAWHNYLLLWNFGGSLMSQYDYSRCPETGTKIVVYKKNDGSGYGAARKRLDADRYTYLCYDFTWADSEAVSFATKEDAEKAVDRYIERVLNELTVLPVLIDTNRLRFAVKCPKCGLVHKGDSDAQGWDSVRQVIRRTCPKVGEEFLIKLWNASDPKFKTARAHQPAAPEGDIPLIPQWNCKECFATGEYIGFHQVEPCSTCYPKSEGG